jgi:hypothetical protein
VNLDINKSIYLLDESDIADNLLHYDYNTKHLLSLIEKGMDPEDPSFLSSYRSFEGEVYENFIYEKLLRYANKNSYIDKFILKGFHQNKFKSHPNQLSISEKQQIVYRTKSREISEFDAIFITTNNELYFVEMTLVKSVLKLRKRLRKKKALLEIIFPSYTIKSLIILNEGASGTKQFPDYCTVWFTKEYSASHILEYISGDKKGKKLQKKEIIKSTKMIQTSDLKPNPFRYYNTMTWITKTLRSHSKHVLDIYFLMNYKIQRYHNLYNKFYIGFTSIATVKSMLDIKEGEYEATQRVFVAIEKKYSDEIVLTYYIPKNRKTLYLYSLDEDKVVKEKKDPYGITVTEVYHINKFMNDKYELTLANLKTIKKLLKESFLRGN